MDSEAQRSPPSITEDLENVCPEAPRRAAGNLSPPGQFDSGRGVVPGAWWDERKEPCEQHFHKQSHSMSPQQKRSLVSPTIHEKIIMSESQQILELGRPAPP